MSDVKTGLKVAAVAVTCGVLAFAFEVHAWNGAQGTPRATAKNYVEALGRHDAEAACKVSRGLSMQDCTQMIPGVWAMLNDGRPFSGVAIDKQVENNGLGQVPVIAAWITINNGQPFTSSALTVDLFHGKWWVRQ